MHIYQSMCERPFRQYIDFNAYNHNLILMHFCYRLLLLLLFFHSTLLSCLLLLALPGCSCVLWWNRNECGPDITSSRNRFNFDNAVHSRRFVMPQIKAKTNLDALKVSGLDKYTPIIMCAISDLYVHFIYWCIIHTSVHTELCTLA